MAALGWLLNLGFAGGEPAGTDLDGVGLSISLGRAELSYDIRVAPNDVALAMETIAIALQRDITGRGQSGSVSSGSIAAFGILSARGQSGSLSRASRTATGSLGAPGLSISLASAAITDNFAGAITGYGLSLSLSQAAIANAAPYPISGRGQSLGLGLAALVNASEQVQTGPGGSFRTRPDDGRAGSARTSKGGFKR